MGEWNEYERMPLVFKSDRHLALPNTRKDYHKKLALYLILACTLFERIAFNALIDIIFITLQSNKPFIWDIHHSQTALYIFSGTSYISTLIFAILSDARLGRARTIIIGFALYLFGYTMVTITMSGKTSLCLFNGTVHRNATVIGEEMCAGPILGTLICTAIGAAAVQSNIAVFGAEQMQGSKITSHYFDKYALVVASGSMIAILIIPYIQHEITIDYYFVPYLVATSMLFVAALLFIFGLQYYIHVKSNETVITKCLPVVINAFQSWYKYKQKRLVVEAKVNSIQLKVVNTSYNHITEADDSMIINRRPSTFLDFAKATNHGKFQERIVDDIKTLRKAFTAFILLVPFWLVYIQAHASFPLQGTHMKHPQNIDYIVSWMALGSPLTVIIGVIIFNKFVYKYLETRNQLLTIETKLVIGMCFASISMCIAGIVEKLRQDGCEEVSEDSSLSIYSQLPQTIFIGFSQLFGMVGSYEYAYLGAPISAQSLFMSFHFCSAGISSFLSAAYIYVFPAPNVDLDFKCHKDRQWYWSFYTYFFILAGLQLIFVVVFIICQKKFHIVKLNPIHIEGPESMIASID